jgi:ABC-type branched-subunit amino acid transport system substrate-binding protein
MRYAGRVTIGYRALVGLLLLGLSAGTACRPRDTAAVDRRPSPVPAATKPPASAPPERGREIFRTGISPSGESISARYGEPPVVVPASMLVCSNCHGEDGLGRSEGGIWPSDITWEALTKPYEVMAEGGRRRPPYTEETLRRAITLGFDSGGLVLGRAMPRFQLARADLDDLIAYMKTLGSAFDPGVTAGAIRIGVILAPRSLSRDAGEPVRGALSAFFEQINEQGGIYGRRIDLRYAEARERVEERASALGAFLAGEPVFALVSPFVAGMEDELADRVSRGTIPVIGPLTPVPRLEGSEGGPVFYLDGGLEGQARALVRYAARARARSLPPAALVWGGSARLRPIVAAVQDECRRAGWPAWTERTLSPDEPGLDGNVDRLQARGIEVVLAVGLGEASGRLMDAAARRGWTPELLVPGSQAGRSVFDAHPGFGGRLVLALGSLPTDLSPEAAGEYRALADRFHLAPRQRAAHWPALAAARLLVEGLRRAGRSASRQRLIAALAALRDYRTGYAPPLTFGPYRRVGAWGAYLVQVAPETGQPGSIGGWLDLDPR